MQSVLVRDVQWTIGGKGVDLAVRTAVQTPKVWGAAFHWTAGRGPAGEVADGKPYTLYAAWSDENRTNLYRVTGRASHALVSEEGAGPVQLCAATADPRMHMPTDPVVQDAKWFRDGVASSKLLQYDNPVPGEWPQLEEAAIVKQKSK